MRVRSSALVAGSSNGSSWPLIARNATLSSGALLSFVKETQALAAPGQAAHHVQRSIDDAPGDITAESGNQEMAYSLFSFARRQPSR